jgi:hypothetical protein
VESAQGDFDNLGLKMKLNLNQERSVHKISTPVNSLVSNNKKGEILWHLLK